MKLQNGTTFTWLSSALAFRPTLVASLLTLSVMGCGSTSGGSGEQSNKPLEPGLYVGRLDCIESVQATDGSSDSQADFRNLNLGVGDSGLPKHEGDEVYVGMQRSGEILGITGTATATEVDAYEDGVTVAWKGNLYSGSDWCTLDISESYKRAGEGAVEHSYTLTMFCTTSPGYLSYSEVCEGVLHR